MAWPKRAQNLELLLKAIHQAGAMLGNTFFGISLLPRVGTRLGKVALDPKRFSQSRPFSDQSASQPVGQLKRFMEHKLGLLPG